MSPNRTINAIYLEAQIEAATVGFVDFVDKCLLYPITSVHVENIGTDEYRDGLEYTVCKKSRLTILFSQKGFYQSTTVENETTLSIF